jgi:hypothetical protein
MLNHADRALDDLPRRTTTSPGERADLRSAQRTAGRPLTFHHLVLVGGGSIMQGWKDDAGSSLNETGLAQAFILARSYGDEVDSWREVFTSDLARAAVVRPLPLDDLTPKPD